MANILSEQWLHPDNYNFWSSEWGGSLVKIVGLVLIVVFGKWIAKAVRKRFECDVEAPVNCEKWGWPVHGTGHRACHEHHPHAESRGSITQEDILRHHEESGA
jgi:hypothetical protein